MEQENIWDNYWKKGLKFKISEFFRKNIISKEVYFYANSYLPDEGIILECGSGGGESSIYLANNNRTIVATDISLSALRIARGEKFISIWWSVIFVIFHLKKRVY